MMQAGLGPTPESDRTAKQLISKQGTQGFKMLRVVRWICHDAQR
jgi:hypothetical protein